MTMAKFHIVAIWLPNPPSRSSHLLSRSHVQSLAIKILRNKIFLISFFLWNRRLKFTSAIVSLQGSKFEWCSYGDTTTILKLTRQVENGSKQSWEALRIIRVALVNREHRLACALRRCSPIRRIGACQARQRSRTSVCSRGLRSETTWSATTWPCWSCACCRTRWVHLSLWSLRWIWANGHSLCNHSRPLDACQMVK